MAFAVCLSFSGPRASALVHAAEALWVPWGPVSVWKVQSRSVTPEVGLGHPGHRRMLLFSFAPLLAEQSHWQVLSLLQLLNWSLSLQRVWEQSCVSEEGQESSSAQRAWQVELMELWPWRAPVCGWDSSDVWNIDLRVRTLPWWQPSQKKCLYGGGTLMCMESCGCAVTLRKCSHLSVVPGSACSSYQYFWKQFTNHRNIVIITCVLRTMS